MSTSNPCTKLVIHDSVPALMVITMKTSKEGRLGIQIAVIAIILNIFFALFIFYGIKRPLEEEYFPCNFSNDLTIDDMKFIALQLNISEQEIFLLDDVKTFSNTSLQSYEQEMKIKNKCDKMNHKNCLDRFMEIFDIAKAYFLFLEFVFFATAYTILIFGHKRKLNSYQKNYLQNAESTVFLLTVFQFLVSFWLIALSNAYFEGYENKEGYFCKIV